MTLEHHPSSISSEEALRERPHIAVAGASGRLGRRLQELLTVDHQLTLLQHVNPITEVQQDHLVFEGFDITDEALVNQTVAHLASEGATLLINCAGIVNVDGSEQERNDPASRTFAVNTIGARNLASACREHHLKLMHISTEYVFNGLKPPGQKYSEDDRPDYDLESAPTFYGLTKALAEKRIMSEYPDGSTIVRVSQVQTPESGLFAATLKALDRGKPFTRANNQLASTLTDITVAEALSKIMNRVLHSQSESHTGIYHLSATDAYSPYEISLMLAEAYGMSQKASDLIMPVTLEELVESGEQRVVRPKNSIFDVTRFQEEFGPLPTVAEEIQHFKNLYGNPAK